MQNFKNGVFAAGIFLGSSSVVTLSLFTKFWTPYLASGTLEVLLGAVIGASATIGCTYWLHISENRELKKSIATSLQIKLFKNFAVMESINQGIFRAKSEFSEVNPDLGEHAYVLEVRHSAPYSKTCEISDSELALAMEIFSAEMKRTFIDTTSNINKMANEFDLILSAKNDIMVRLGIPNNPILGRGSHTILEPATLSTELEKVSKHCDLVHNATGKLKKELAELISDMINGLDEKFSINANFLTKEKKH